MHHGAVKRECRNTAPFSFAARSTSDSASIWSLRQSFRSPDHRPPAALSVHRRAHAGRASGAQRRRPKELKMNAIVKFPDTERYARAIEASKAVHWEIDKDVIKGRGFELGHKFLPDGLVLASEFT